VLAWDQLGRTRLPQDDYYYEIQLTNKQLVFYFLAGATGLILSFLAGVMVGRGVDAPGELDAVQPVREDRILAEEPRPSPPAAQEMTYAESLEADDSAEATLSRQRPSPVPLDLSPRHAVTPPARPPSTPAPSASPTPEPPRPVATSPTPPPLPPSTTPWAQAGAGAFSIQVGAFKDRASAEGLMGRLKAKGYVALVVPDRGLFNVRVGSYANRVEAERVQAKLREQEKLNTFIVPKQ